MTFARMLGSLALAGTVALGAMSVSASAQEIGDTHLRAARAALAALRTTEEFDTVLPQAAIALKTELIQKNPDLQQLIIRTVDETAMSLAGRRADLEREAAAVYARVFNEAELNEIAAFYSSPTGSKLINDGPIVLREIFQAAEIWQNGIARDLAQQVAEKIAAQAPSAEASSQ